MTLIQQIKEQLKELESKSDFMTVHDKIFLSRISKRIEELEHRISKVSEKTEDLENRIRRKSDF
jgi:polyhydroxyalkanoate synthesis regulator phasin